MPAIIAFLVIVGLAIATFAAWVTHIVACIAAGAWILLIIGCIVAPVGVIHGIMVWFGASWVAF